ncbi:hypothetical protein AYI69_g2251 [Smittium culicis]|uniref:Uncharacterized protein n=1 Tax=Smittium culicis TaxID=133412 RepID=A0A1R1YMY0_9FUNG|nr:hypothetical protein AYI69_g2251 [Smittium culicis]
MSKVNRNAPSETFGAGMLDKCSQVRIDNLPNHHIFGNGIRKLGDVSQEARIKDSRASSGSYEAHYNRETSLQGLTSFIGKSQAMSVAMLPW